MDFTTLIPQFSSFFFTVVTFVLALSVIVAVHEYGHYIVGRWSGIHPEVFSLGFGPVLWSRVDKRGTRWQIAALPFGGYVKFLGDSDAASGKDGAAIAAAEDDPALLRKTMHGAPLWARAATVAAGPVFNFVLSAIVFAALMLAQGQARDPMTIGTLHPLPFENQLQPGDGLLRVAGLEVPSLEDGDAWAAFIDAIPHEAALPYLVAREGREVEVQGPYWTLPYVSLVAPRSAASAAGLAPGDVITAIDKAPIFSFDQLKQEVEGGNGRVLLLTVWRDGEALELALAPRRTDEPQADGSYATHWRIGVMGGQFFEPATQSLPLGQAAWGGVTRVWDVITSSLSGMGHMITGAISTCNLSGPIGIAQTSGDLASQGLERFISFIAVLSTAVGLMNLFPVPVLDGGHLLFFAYEAVTGRPPNDRVMQVLMALGLAMILTLMVFAIGNDLFC